MGILKKGNGIIVPSIDADIDVEGQDEVHADVYTDVYADVTKKLFICYIYLLSIFIECPTASISHQSLKKQYENFHAILK